MRHGQGVQLIRPGWTITINDESRPLPGTSELDCRFPCVRPFMKDLVSSTEWMD